MIVQLKLPSGAKLIPSENSSIKIGEPFYSIGQEDIESIPVAEKLKINPHDIFAFVNIVVGEEVAENAIIASKKGLVGKKKVHSPYKGIIVKINHETGAVDINKGSQSKTKELSYINGKIIKYNESDNVIEVEIKGGVEFKSDTVSHTGGGALYYLLDERDYFHIDEKLVKNNLIVLKSIQPQIVTKLEALSATGIISSSGETVADFPCIIIQEESFKKLVTNTYKFIVYSSHTNQIIAYN